MNKHFYREHDGALTMQQLGDAMFTHELVEVSERDDGTLHANYECWNEDCHVRFVTIDAAWLDGKQPHEVQFHCPGCGERVTHQAFVKCRTLLPVEWLSQ